MTRLTRNLLVAAMALMFAAPTAHAGETVIGTTFGTAPSVVTFDFSDPASTLTSTSIKGLLAGEEIMSIDQRTATGQIFAHTDQHGVLLLDPLSGETVRVGASLDPSLFNGTLTSGTDFNPTVDRFRMVNAGAPASGQNVRFNPVTFTIVDADGGTPGTQADASLAFIATDPNVGADPNVVAAAYDRNDNDGGTPTTMFVLDASLNAMLRQGAVDGNAGDAAGGGSPNGGLLTTIGGLGVDFTDASFDTIYGADGSPSIGYAVVQTTTNESQLRTVNLANGASTLIGNVGVGRLSGMTLVRGGALRVTGATATESSPTVSFTVQRDGNYLPAVTVAYRTTSATALAGSDFSPASGTLTFSANESSKVVPVSLIQDGNDEEAEVFSLELSGATGGALIRSAAAPATILDDDGPFQILALPSPPKSLRALLKSKRIRTEISCSQACSISQKLTLGRATIGTAVASLTSPGVAKVTMRLSSKGVKALKKFRGKRATLKLATTAIGEFGTTRTSNKSLRVKR